MRTLEQALADLDARHAKARESVITEYEVRELLPSREAKVHIGELYGTAGSVVLSCKPHEVAGVVAALPSPVPTVLLRRGSLSFVTEAYAATVPDDRVDSQESIWPYWLTAEPNAHSQRLEINWIGAVGARLMRFKVEVPLYLMRELVSIHIEWNRSGGETTLKSQRIVIASALHSIGAVANLAQTIKWASGGPEYASSYTLYWTPNVEQPEHPRATFAAWLNELLKGD